MKKKIFILIAMMVSAITMKAQTALQTSELFDNVYVGAEVGVATPLTFDHVFPLNPLATLRVGKQFTPVWGAEVEGTAWFGSHIHGSADARFDGLTHNVVRGSYVGVNGTINLSNLLFGYKGKPRHFEVSTVLGSGWIHTFTPNASDKANNYFGVKTGLDFAVNLGHSRTHTVNLRPSILWDVTNPSGTMPLQFDKRFAQLNVSVGYTYHFNTSNGTRYFKQYNIGEYEATIAKLNEELSKKPKEVTVEKIVTKEVVKEVIKEVPVEVPTRTVVDKSPTVVFFAKNSAVLTDEAKAALDRVKGIVTVKAYASPEGSEAYNQELSEKRAYIVSEYLIHNGVTVDEAVGCGVDGDASNRVAIVTVQ